MFVYHTISSIRKPILLNNFQRAWLKKWEKKSSHDGMWIWVVTEHEWELGRVFKLKKNNQLRKSWRQRRGKKKGKIRAQKTKRDENKNKCQGITFKKKHMAEEWTGPGGSLPMASVLPIIRQGEKSPKHCISFYNPQTNKKKPARQQNI